MEELEKYRCWSEESSFTSIANNLEGMTSKADMPWFVIAME